MFYADEDKNDEAKQNGLASHLLKTRTILLTGQVDQELAERVISQLVILDADSEDPIRFIICSQGGHVDSGFAIYDMMRFVKSPVYAIGTGWVASIAVPIMMGAAKEHRLSLPNARFLIHQPSGGVGGQAADIRIEAQEIIKLRLRINELISAETGQKIEKVTQDSDRNYWMNAEEAKNYGLVSKIVKNVRELG